MTNFKLKFIVVLFCLWGNAVLGQSKNKDFLIVGTIKSGEDVKLYISQFDGSFNPTLNRDSIQTINGKFTYRMKAKYPKLVYIYIPQISFNGKIIFLVNQETCVTIDLKNWDGFFVSGSAQTNAYHSFIKEYEQAFSLFNISSSQRIPKFKRDTLEGKVTRRLIESQYYYMIITDTFSKAGIPIHTISDKPRKYPSFKFTDREEILTGYVIKYYGDTSETHLNNVVYKHLALNKNNEVGAIIAYQHFVSRDFSESANSAYRMLTPYSQNTSYGKRMKHYIDLNTTKQHIDFAFTDQTGKHISLSSLHSKYVLVHFWASWCGNCRPENKMLATLYQKYTRDQLEFVNISFDQNKADWLKAIEKDSLPGYHTSKLKDFDSEIGRLFHVRGLPSSFLLDGKRNIILINPGEPSWIESKIDAK